MIPYVFKLPFFLLFALFCGIVIVDPELGNYGKPRALHSPLWVHRVMGVLGISLVVFLTAKSLSRPN